MINAPATTIDDAVVVAATTELDAYVASVAASIGTPADRRRTETQYRNRLMEHAGS